MTTLDTVLNTLDPLARSIHGMDLAHPQAAAQLEAAHPFASLAPVGAVLRAARDAGVLTPKQATPTLSFGRVAKASPETHGLSIDAVDIEGTGAEHTHLKGEVSLCFAESGDPRFDGHPEGWVVLPPGSHHAPTVTGGRMLIVYFLPDGALKWGPQG